jgi:hypothetical protein
MSEWRAKVGVTVAFGVVAAVLLVRASRRGPVSPPAVPSAVAVEADANVPDAATVDAGTLDAGADVDAAAAPVLGICERLAKRSADALAPVKKHLPHETVKLPELCVTTPHATWALVAERATMGAPSTWPDSKGLGVAVRLVHVDVEGNETSVLPVKAMHETWQADGGALVVNMTLAATWGSVSLASLGAFDYDGDDDPEVLLEGSAADEGPDRRATEAWTFHEGKIVPYAPLAGVDIVRVEDLDDDGRPDIIGPGRYARVEAMSGIGAAYPIAPPIFALHSLAGGTFSATDAVARAFSKSHCPTKPTLDFDEHLFGDNVAEAVLCARLWGTTAADVRTAWEKACKGVEAGADMECQQWPKELGAITPPFVLK